jgi:hypothetical protein
VALIQNKGKDSLELLSDPKLRRKLDPTVEMDGKPCEVYFPPKDNPPVPGHTQVTIRSDGKDICDMSIKATEIENAKFEVVTERDFRSPVVASILKAAHLTMFRMLGYKYVFSTSGDYAAHILREFFLTYRTRESRKGKYVDEYFWQHHTMVAPIRPVGDAFLGTKTDNKLISCYDTHDHVFTYGVIVKAGTDMFCVFLPTGIGSTINTYISFLNKPPSAISTRTTRFSR